MSGEAGFVTDTNTLKIGNGSTAFASLDEIGGGSTSGGIAETFETVAKNLDASGATYAYSDGELTSVTYANGVVKTLAYGANGLASVTLSGTTPGGIDLVKTLSYTDGELTGVSYT
jgi:hypothetical protein